MYRSPLLNKAIIPVLALGSLTYAVYATGVMRPRSVVDAPLIAPPAAGPAHTIAAVGLVEPASELVAVAPRVAGWIEKVHVAAGQVVRAGDPLFTLDGTDLRAEKQLRDQAVLVAQSKLGRLKAMPRPEDVPIARAALDASKASLEETHSKLRIVENVVDPRAVSREEVIERRAAFERQTADVAAKQADLDRLLAGAWKQDIAVAENELAMARAAVARIDADIERLTTRAPMDAVVLRITARAGQFAATGASEDPLVTLGSPGALHVRADVNEQDAPRILAGASAVAMVRGDAGNAIPLEFVRVEPMVTPKRAFSGFAQERVDTRVMQVIFRLKSTDVPVLVGQQVDLYIDDDGTGPAAVAAVVTASTQVDSASLASRRDTCQQGETLRFP